MMVIKYSSTDIEQWLAVRYLNGYNNGIYESKVQGSNPVYYINLDFNSLQMQFKTIN